MQPLVARDGGSAGRGGGGDGGTDRGAVLGSGGAKEVAQPGGDLAVGRRTAMFLMWGGMGWANVGGVSTSILGLVVCVLGRGCGWDPTIPTKTATWKLHCDGLLSMECRQMRSFGRPTRPTARVPGFATNRAGPSRSVGAGRSLDVNGGLGSRECRVEVYWVAGATARSRRRRSVSRWCTRRLGHAIRFLALSRGVDRQRFGRAGNKHSSQHPFYRSR